MKSWAIFIGVIATALAAAALALRPPAPLPASAAAQAFSAARALPDVAAIARRPHPIRSAEEARVRDVLFGRMVDLGLRPQLRPVDTARGTLFNLVGVLPSSNRPAPSVLLMAHYDSVAAGPGAADDGAGVAAVLEIARALQAAPRTRDVMVLLTEGEETGLFGARGFFTADPLRAHVGAVINLEARGDRGRAVMFETHRQDGAMIDALTRAGALTGASSLMPDLYRRLPNTTDLTEAMKQGYPGLNFALFDGLETYHQPSDTPQRLQPGALQSLGQQALAATRALATAPALPGRAPDRVYADILGGPVLVYPPAAGWAIFGLAVIGIGGGAWRALTLGRTSLGGMIAGFFFASLLLVLLIGVLLGEGALRLALAGYHLAPLLRHGGEMLTGTGLVAAGLTALVLWGAQTGLQPASLALGALKLVALGALVLQIAAPLDAFMLGWPLLLGAAAMALRIGGDRLALPAALLAAAALAEVFYWAGLLHALVGQQTPVVLAPFALVCATLLLPFATRIGRVAGLTALMMGLIGLIVTLTAMRA